jgi:hypothetical protein
VHLVGDYATPWVIGHASDPLVTVTDGTKTINVRIPLGTVPEAPYHSTDASIGGADATQPYLVWSITGAVINTGSVQPYGSVITGRQLCIDDGAGPIMCDAITGQPGTNNSIGAIQDSDLTLANAAWTSDPNRSYVIPHMLTYSLDPSQCNSGAAIWPSFVIDERLPTTGGLNQGYTIGIPLSTPRPAGKSPGFYLLFDSLQQYGWAFNNLSGTGCLSIDCYSTNPANATLAADVAASINAVMPYIGILSNQTGIASVKGYQPGGFNAFPAPPLLDLSPTGGLNVAPATFEAWYPSGFNVTP